MDINAEEFDEIFQWSDKYCIGVEEVDTAHERLFSIVRRLIKNLTYGDYEKNKITCIEAIKYLKQYTIEHFAQEEAFQQEIGYHGYENHKRIHDNMRDVTIPSLEKQMYMTDFSKESVEHFAGVCAAWLSAHIMLEDQAIVGKVRSQWEVSINTDAMSILKNNAEVFMNRLFQLEIQPENLNYDAYDIGNTVNHYTIFRGKNNTIYRSVVILEKGLACHSLGKLLNKEIKHLTEITLSMIKELSQSFVRDFIEKYTGDTEIALLSEGMVDKSAFELDFKSYHPDISMLWNTDYGHIAFCTKVVRVQQS